MLLLSLWACSPRLPSTSFEGVSLVSVGLERADVELRFSIDNPLPAEVRAEALRWLLAVNDHTLAEGTLDDPPPLAANGPTLVAIPVSVRYLDVYDALGEGVRAAPYRIAAEVDLPTPFGTYTLPVEHRGRLPSFTLPDIDLVDLGFGTDDGALRMDLTLRVGLPTSVALGELEWTLTASEYTLARGAAALVDDGTLTLSVQFLPGDTAWAAAEAVYEGRTTLVMDLVGRVVSPLGTAPVQLTRELSLGDP